MYIYGKHHALGKIWLIIDIITRHKHFIKNQFEFYLPLTNVINAFDDEKIDNTKHNTLFNQIFLPLTSFFLGTLAQHILRD